MKHALKVAAILSAVVLLGAGCSGSANVQVPASSGSVNVNTPAGTTTGNYNYGN